MGAEPVPVHPLRRGALILAAVLAERLRFERTETGEGQYVVRSRFRDRRTRSTFSVARRARDPRVAMVFMLVD